MAFFPVDVAGIPAVGTLVGDLQIIRRETAADQQLLFAGRDIPDV